MLRLGHGRIRRVVVRGLGPEIVISCGDRNGGKERKRTRSSISARIRVRVRSMLLYSAHFLAYSSCSFT